MARSGILLRKRPEACHPAIGSVAFAREELCPGARLCCLLGPVLMPFEQQLLMVAPTKQKVSLLFVVCCLLFVVVCCLVLACCC